MYHRSDLSFNHLYARLNQDCARFGDHYCPRGLECVELRPASFTIAAARHGLYTGYSRRLNYRFLAVETLSYIAGWGSDPAHAALLCRTNPNMARYLNPATKIFDGAYGPRLAKSLPAIVDLLRRDPSSRQAVASIWAPGIPTSSLDVPCTLHLHAWHTAKGHLELQASMRSNDLNWGTPYDVAAFCAIQCALATVLKVAPGAYHHVAGSLHLYLATPPEVAPFELEKFLTWPAEVPYSASSDFSGWDQLRAEAADLLIDVAMAYESKRRVVESELVNGPRGDYWGRWLALINFKWGRYEGAR